MELTNKAPEWHIAQGFPARTNMHRAASRGKQQACKQTSMAGVQAGMPVAVPYPVAISEAGTRQAFKKAACCSERQWQANTLIHAQQAYKQAACCKERQGQANTSMR
eukprot:1075696-Pelagomonas_calceolata.AAC.4